MYTFVFHHNHLCFLPHTLQLWSENLFSFFCLFASKTKKTFISSCLVQLNTIQNRWHRQRHWEQVYSEFVPQLTLPANWKTLVMTLRVSDWQLESDLDNIRNSCDVFSLNLSLSFLYFIWISSLFQIQGLLIVDFLSPCPSMVAKSVKVFSTCSAKTQCLRFCFCISTHLYFIFCGNRGEYLWADSLPAGHDPESLRPHPVDISTPNISPPTPTTTR